MPLCRVRLIPHGDVHIARVVDAATSALTDFTQLIPRRARYWHWPMPSPYESRLRRREWTRLRKLSWQRPSEAGDLGLTAFR